MRVEVPGLLRRQLLVGSHVIRQVVAFVHLYVYTPSRVTSNGVIKFPQTCAASFRVTPCIHHKHGGYVRGNHELQVCVELVLANRSSVRTPGSR